MSNIDHYNQLIGDKSFHALAPMHSAALNTTSSHQDLQQTKQTIQAFSPESGWTLYRDKLSTAPTDLTRQDLIEGEWHSQNQSLKVRMIKPNRFLVIQSRTEQGESHAYQDVQIMLQPVSGEQRATYRIWWQQADSGERIGRWSPVFQQFIGFDNGGNA
ncbi:hypothetical protein ACNUDM_08320 [Vibrio chaetopteri]|uniref:hypothetical protein n=1 Tax=Vibrio chaetopteri TaxID=3016528 RepID=UPI003AB6D609